MHRFPKSLTTSPQGKFPEGAKLLSPQRVDVTTGHFIPTKPFHSQSQQNIETTVTKIPQTKTNKNETFLPINNKEQYAAGSNLRPDTAQGNMAGESYKGLSGILKNTSNPRPMTSGDGYLVRPLSIKTEPAQKQDTKLRTLGTLNSPSRGLGLMGGQPEQEFVFETTKEDREAVQDLERWDSEFKMLMMSKTMETDQKKDNNQIQFSSEYLENHKMPILNREILNLLDVDEGMNEKDLKYAQTGNNMAKINKQKARIPQKSLETIMTEYNKKILNDILFHRVSKKLNLKESSQNKLDLDYTTKTISTGTIGNFKNLQTAMQSNPRIIEYENLYHKLTVQKNMPEKVFDFDEDCKRIQEAENDYGAIETNLKAQYEAIIGDIHKKKDTLNEIRLSVHNNNNEIAEVGEEIEELWKKYQALEAQHNQHREQNKMLARSNTRGKRGAMKDTSNRSGIVEEYSKYQRQMDEKKEQVRELKEAVEDLENENKKNQQRASNFEREIKDLKFKKNQVRIQLKQLYYKILKNEDHIFKHEASFITIIKNLWRINEEVVEDIFPSFVDREALAYLVENAKLEYKLEQLEVYARSDDAKEMQYAEALNREEAKRKFKDNQKLLRAPLSEQVADVKQRLQNLKKGIVRMKKPVFIKDGTSKSRIIRWEELNLETDEWDGNLNNEENVQEKINTAIANIKTKLAELKAKEINRIFSLYINKEVDEKSLKNLNKILISLFGRHDAERTYQQFIRLKQSHDFKISQNKTFIFSSTKQFSSSKASDKTKNSYILMLSNATNLKNDENKNLKELAEEKEKKLKFPDFSKQLNQYQEISDMEVNPNYNLNFNYAPHLQDKDFRSSFYMGRLSSPKEAGGMKSSLRDKEKMSKTGQSFNKVSFKEPNRPLI